MEHNEDQIERISNVLPGLPSMTSFVYGGRPLSRPGWWSEAALRPCTYTTIADTTESSTDLIFSYFFTSSFKSIAILSLSLHKHENKNKNDFE